MGMRAVGYFRDAAEGNGPPTSLADQNRRFLDFCRRAGYDVSATFLDDADDGQPSGFRQMVEYLRRQPAGTLVVVDSLDHLGADVRQAARRCFQLLALGAGIVFIAEEGDDPVTALLARWNERDDRERLSERVREAMRRKAVKGEVLGRPPYGYRVGQRRRLELIPEEADVVRYIFRLYTQEGLGIRLIARRLNEEGYRTRRGGNWSMVTIRDILRNRAYLGTYARFGVRVPGSHPAIVGSEDFRRAQERLADRRTAGGPRNVSPFVLSGLAVCGSCGRHMIGVSRRQTWQRRSDGGTSSAEYRYYQCGSRTNQSICAYHTRRTDELDEAVRAAAIEALGRRLDEQEPSGAGPHLAGEIGKLTARLHLLDRDLERLLDQAAGGLLNRGALCTAAVDIAARQIELEDALAEAARRNGEMESRAARRGRRVELLRRLRDEWEKLSLPARHDLLAEALDHAVIHDDRVEAVLRD